jgi:nuclear GTP-binding protein
VPLDRLTDPDAVMASEPTLSTLASEVEASSSSTQKLEDPLFSETPGLSSVSGRTKEQMRKYYIRSLHKVVDQSDIIFLVLDARDPEGCRSRLV